jgi:hypothetical protein
MLKTCALSTIDSDHAAEIMMKSSVVECFCWLSMIQKDSKFCGQVSHTNQTKVAYIKGQWGFSERNYIHGLRKHNL